MGAECNKDDIGAVMTDTCFLPAIIEGLKVVM
jgi:hypothetical protein